MGTWSAEPIGNDAAADFVAELDGERRWTVVKAAFSTAAKLGDTLDSDTAATAIAAAEVVAHGLGRPTQTDAYTESIKRIVGRARRPSRRLADRAIQAVHDAARPDGELAELWAETESSDWQDSLRRLLAALEER